ncbi:MAG: hypothetical protein ACI4D3_09590 [Lachnospiraceae bacterium]
MVDDNIPDSIWQKKTIVKTLGDKGNELTDNQGATTAYSNTGLDSGKTYTQDACIQD